MSSGGETACTLETFNADPKDRADSLQLPDIGELNSALKAAPSRVSLLRQVLQQVGSVLDQRYRREQCIYGIVQDRARMVDEILRLAWQLQDWPDPADISLVAVGGYGRGELLPHSDIDLLILTRSERNKKFSGAISRLLTLLWDIGLRIGQSVRSVRQCRQEAIKDITVATALMESRTLAGTPELHQQMMVLTHSRRVWPIKRFLQAKVAEQEVRHRKYHDVDYSLEPNVKNSPGGLRDIQTIAWVTHRHFGAVSFQDLVELGFLKPAEKDLISQGQRFLWKLRYGLHLLSGRCEDRLLFDRQRQLAEMFGYRDDDRSLGVEKLMQEYYQAVGNLRELNDMLLQHLDEAILRAGEPVNTKPLNARFQICNDYIETVHEGVFQNHPSALIEVFVLMAQNPDIKGIRASTIRLLHDNRSLIDEDFRQSKENCELFIQLLRTSHQMTLQLRRMARYGILGRYLPEFGKVTGQMQHDLFHIYTVDAHTLQVVENLRRFRLPEAEEQYPIAADIFRSLTKPELLYIAGLYHDIAKGRGGDHSELGKMDAELFCRRHGLSEWDTSLVVWLVANHLLMSMVAQRKDITDPNVIRAFAEQVGDCLHLDYLYTLTVADISATNPDLWNSWRASLMAQLYTNTTMALLQGQERTVNREARIADTRETARQELLKRGLELNTIESVWKNTAKEYFVGESVRNILWHTEAIATYRGDIPLISIREIESGRGIQGATLVFLYTRDADFLFANSTAAFEKLGLNIFSARLFTSDNGYCMNTFTVLEPNGRPVGDNRQRLREIEQVLREQLDGSHQPREPASMRLNRKLRYFNKPIQTCFVDIGDQSYSALEVNCPDHPGILACVGKVFAENRIQLRDARIVTLGERIEDLFMITDADGGPIRDPETRRKLQSEIKHELESRLDLQAGLQ